MLALLQAYYLNRGDARRRGLVDALLLPAARHPRHHSRARLSDPCHPDAALQHADDHPHRLYRAILSVRHAHRVRHAPGDQSRSSSRARAQAAPAGCRRMRFVLLPLLLPAIIAAWLMLFVIFIRELGATILLYAQGTETISVALVLLSEHSSGQHGSARGHSDHSPARGLPAVSPHAGVAGAEAEQDERGGMPMDAFVKVDNLRQALRRPSPRSTAFRSRSATVTPLRCWGRAAAAKPRSCVAIAGLETPEHGSIAIGGRAVFDSASRINLMPEERELGIVFQSYAVWPHMTVAENVGFPLKVRGMAKAERAARVGRILDIVGLSAARTTSRRRSFSGGQQQRVALARALVHEPRLVLVRRAAVQSRRAVARPDAAGTQGAAGPSRLHRHLCDPRPG